MAMIGGGLKVIGASELAEERLVFPRLETQVDHEDVR